MSVEDRWHHKGSRKRTKDYGRGKRWRVRHGDHPVRSFDKQEDAITWDNQLKAADLTGELLYAPNKSDITVEEYAAKWLVDQYPNVRSRKAVESRLRNHVYPTHGKRPVRKITVSVFKEWLSDMRSKTKRNGKPYAEGTIRVVYVHYASMLRSAVIDGTLRKHPADNLKNLPVTPSRKVTSVWERPTVDRLVAAHDDRNRPIPLLSATCGHRQGESFAVAEEDIDDWRRKITIRHQVQMVDGKIALVPPKGGKTRVVPAPRVTRNALRASISRYGTLAVRCECCKRVNHLIFFKDGQMLSPTDWNRRHWHPALQAVDITPAEDEETGQHQLRHHYASVLIYAGRPITEVSENMGHASISVTGDVYGHVFESARLDALDALDNVFDGMGTVTSDGATDPLTYPERTAEAA
ncbi:tyrosine-type recombinase/integrase [Amycolatopsis anabasis]|uniref:tyrosine-type recombinase/integrase n=1 Tax=Amycolatopsis anabasis TaxID=1840409 RepID=UPI00131C21E2|nr:site-specific integrase [Amycolatopsis anabasis]